MRLNFVKLNPNGNVTLLVISPVPRDQQPNLAARILRGEVSASAPLRSPFDWGVARWLRGDVSGNGGGILSDVEQVGFAEPARLPGARARLQMMGGEFCGNASMALAALLAALDWLDVGKRDRIALEVSGADDLVLCRVERPGARDFIGSASMPLPEGFDEFALPNGPRVPLVRFPGIAHLIVPEESLSERDAEALIPKLCAELNADALGILLTDAALGTMRPLVYVRSTDSAVWERGCGSGTAALGAWAAKRAGETASLDVRQPGGSIGVRAVLRDTQVQTLEIQGTIRLVTRGIIEA